MTLRLVLVALVGLMSLELPSRQELANWQASGGRWVDSRMADLSQLKRQIEETFDGTSESVNVVKPAETDDSLAREIAQMRADAAFETAMDGLSTDFKADLVAIEAARPVAEEAPRVAGADRLLVPSVEQSEATCFDPESETPQADFVPVMASSRPVDRFSSALSLTRQALSAWASVLEAGGEDSR